MTDIFKTTIRLLANTEEQVRNAMAKRRVRSLQQVIDEAVELWLQETAAPAPRAVHGPHVATPGATKEEQALVGTFLDFLRTGDAGTVELMKHALELHSKRQRSQRKRSSA